MWRKHEENRPDNERVIKDPERARARTMNRAVKLLAAKSRSIGQLRERLLEKNWTNAEIVDRVIAKLEEYGYLDDEKFAADLAMSKLRQKPQGKRGLRQTLSRKKLSPEDVTAAVTLAFEKLPESEMIGAAIAKRLRLKGVPQSREDAKKFYDHLMRRGFELDLIRSKLSEMIKSDSLSDR